MRDERDLKILKKQAQQAKNATQIQGKFMKD